MPAEPPRTLADQLRGWSDEQVARLLTERPDLASPPPQDSSQLASRIGIRASVVRAVDQLSQLELTVLDAVLALGGTTSVPALRAAVNASTARVDTALERVRALCLVWGTDDHLRALSVLTDVLGTRISGLGSPASTLLAGYGPAKVAALAQQLGLTSSGDRHHDVAAVAAVLADPQAFAPPVVAVVSGGNIDPLLMMKVVQHGMAAAGRYLSLRVQVPDRPGSLAALLHELAGLSANVLSVEHERTTARLDLGEVEVGVHLETRGPDHARAVLAALSGAGYSPRVD